MTLSEADLRRDLAAAFRLAEAFGYSEGICNHFSLQVPGVHERFLINAYGVHWSEMTGEKLLLIDGDGAVIEGEGEVEATARNIHIAAHRANPRHACVLHVHMPSATSLTMVQNGRLAMAHQTATRFYQRIAYHDDFGGLALEAAEGEAITAINKENASADVVFLANHGITIGGPSVAVAFDDLYYLDRACHQQLLAMSTGLPLKLIPEPMLSETARQYMQVLEHQAILHFDALKRVHGV